MESPSLADPWQRFWARQLDSTLMVLVTGFIVGIAVAIYDETLLEQLGDSRVADLALGWLLMPFAFVLDALVYTAFGNTPGKALLGIRVASSAPGGRLSFPQYVRRNLGVWFYGFGTGFPIVVLITMVHQHGVLSSGETLRWDAAAGTQVVSHADAGWRLVAGAGITILFKAALYVL